MANDLSHRQAYQGANFKWRNPKKSMGYPWDITKNMGSIGVLGFLEYPGQEIRLKTWGET